MSSGYGPRRDPGGAPRASEFQRPRRRASLGQRRSPRRGPGPWRRLAVPLGFVLAGLVGAGAYFAPSAWTALTQTGNTSALSHPGSLVPLPPSSPFTVLLLGSDDDAKFDKNSVLTQSMILVRVDPRQKTATMMSIPRDLWVPLSTGQTAKIDAAYEYGGSKAAIATVERNFGVHVDDYVWIGLKGLVQLIDKLGGVDVVTTNPVLDDFYPNDLNSANPYSYTRVAVLPGAQHLNGTNALKYVRSRHNDVRSDLGRSQRQQQVLLSLRAKAGTVGIGDIPGLTSSFNGEFSTSISVIRIGALLELARAFDNSKVKQIVLEPPFTSGAQVAGQDVLIPDWSQIRPLVEANFG